MRSEDPTVYSTESGRMCPKCGRALDHCVCKKQVTSSRRDGTTQGGSVPKGDGIPRGDGIPPKDGVVRIFRDSKSRKGKTVTLVTGIPLKDEALKALASEFKRQLGSGGAVKDGVIEIQGDHREVLLEELKKRGYKVKLAGG